MRPLRPASFLVLLALVAGCGGDDDEGDDGGKTTTTANAVQQDARAKGAARDLATVVEACFADEATYAGCADVGEGLNVAEATVESATDTTYTVVSPSASGNEFRVEKTEAGELARTCATAGEGGCRPDGTW